MRRSDIRRLAHLINTGYTITPEQERKESQSSLALLALICFLPGMGILLMIGNALFAPGVQNERLSIHDPAVQMERGDFFSLKWIDYKKAEQSYRIIIKDFPDSYQFGLAYARLPDVLLQDKEYAQALQVSQEGLAFLAQHPNATALQPNLEYVAAELSKSKERAEVCLRRKAPDPSRFEYCR